MFLFELGREFKLSIAEIVNFFPEGKIVFFDKSILIIENIGEEKVLEISKKIGGTIKISKLKEVFGELQNIFKENLNLESYEGKFHYGINIFGERKYSLKDLLKVSKNVIKENELNPRFINKDFKNLTSVQVIKEGLVKKGNDFNIVFIGEKIYFGNTIFVQDIYGYSNRDYGKDRDMHVGMLPPKLAQIMINLSGGKNIYDPFVGLGTVLIESVYMGNKKVFGSDLSERMVETSKENLEKLKGKFDFEKNIFFQNAKYINEIDFLGEVDAIVTEGYLGEIMTKNNINHERILKQRKSLSDLYEGFFSGLKKQNFKGNIVISFPFWELNGKYFYFEEIYDIINKEFNIYEILTPDLAYLKTKMGSLLYKRDSQLVGREIFCLRLK